MRTLVSILVLVGLICGVFYIVAPKPQKNLYDPGVYCPFCDPKVLDVQTFYEDDLVRALYTHKPIYPGHCLVIPKRHVPRFEGLTEQEASQMMQTIKKVNTAVQQVFGDFCLFALAKERLRSGTDRPSCTLPLYSAQSGRRF